MIVTREDLHAQLELVKARIADPGAGIFGPGSTSWLVNRESIVFLGGGAAALLQLAHPYVAHAIEQHSATRTDVAGRFQRTFANVFAMAFGPADEAFRAARKVHAIHSRITGEIGEDVGRFRRGDRYAANDVDALLWVFATLVHTSIRVVEMVVRPLSASERERYYRESKLFAHLFGIPDSRLPADWTAFCRYFAATCESDTIAVGAVARELGEFLMRPPRPSHAPVWRWYRIMTAGLLPRRLRRDFGLPMGLREQVVFRSSIGVLGSALRVLPKPVRYLPKYVDARRRLQGRGPSPISRFMERLLQYGVSGEGPVFSA